MGDRFGEGHHGADQHHEHHRVSHLDPGVELLQGIDRGVGEDLTVEQAAIPAECARPHIVVLRRSGGGGRLKLLDFWHSAQPSVIRLPGHQKNFPCDSCSTIGPSDTAGKKVSAPTIMITPMSRPMNMGLSVRNVPADAGTTFLAARAPARASTGMMMANRPSSRPMVLMTL